MSSEKICPIMTAGSYGSGYVRPNEEKEKEFPSLDGIIIKCQKENCQMWNDDRNDCALKLAEY